MKKIILYTLPVLLVACQNSSSAVNSEDSAKGHKDSGQVRKYALKMRVVKLPVFQTINYVEYSVIKPEKALEIGLPSNWSIDGTVIYDSARVKIGEFIPGWLEKRAVSLSDSLLKYRNMFGSDEFNAKFIGLDTLAVAGKEIIQRISSALAFGGPSPEPWMVNEYFIDMDQGYLVLGFYDRKNYKIDPVLIKEILESILLGNKVNN